MASEKKQRLQFNRFGTRDHVQTINSAGSSTSALSATTIVRLGVTVIESTGTGAGHTWTLAEPVKGIRKTIVMHGPGTSTLPAFVQTNSSAVIIGETTGNKVTFSTLSLLDGSVVDLIGLSSVAWVLGAVLPTGVSIAAATML